MRAAYMFITLSHEKDLELKNFSSKLFLRTDGQSIIISFQIVQTHSPLPKYCTVTKTAEQTGRTMSMAVNLMTLMLTVNSEIATQRNYPNCDFWKNTKNIVPTYANLD